MEYFACITLKHKLLKIASYYVRVNRHPVKKGVLLLAILIAKY